VSEFTRLRARIGGLSRFARMTEAERAAAMAPARLAFQRKFENEPNPEAAKRLYYARLALKRWQTKRRKRTAA
jgi:hypothetical protein